MAGLDNSFFIDGLGGNAAPKILSQANRTTAGGVYMAKLGDYMFSLDTAAFQTLERQTEYRWQGVNRIGRKPGQQFTGEGDDVITLAGIILPTFRGGIAQLGLMRQAAADGKPLPLTYAFEQVGQYCGLWVIKSIREGRAVFFRDGVPRRIEFSLTLQAYGADNETPANIAASIASGVASAVASTTSIATPSLLGDSGRQVTVNDGIISSLQPWTTSDGLPSLNKIADTMRAVTSAARQIAAGQLPSIEPLVRTLPSGVGGVVSAETVAQARVIYDVARQIVNGQPQFDRAIRVLSDSYPDLRTAASGYATELLASKDLLVQYGGLVKAKSIELSGRPAQAGVTKSQVLTASAMVRNASNATDNLIFAANESARQLNALTGMIIG